MWRRQEETGCGGAEKLNSHSTCSIWVLLYFFLSPVSFCPLPGGLLQQQHSLRSPECVYQVRGDQPFRSLRCCVLFSRFYPFLPCWPSSPPHEPMYVMPFIFLSVCLQLQPCRLDYFVIKLVSLVQTQYGCCFRQILECVCVCVHTHTEHVLFQMMKG